MEEIRCFLEGIPRSTPRPRGFMVPMLPRGMPPSRRAAACQKGHCHSVRFVPGQADTEWRKRMNMGWSRFLRENDIGPGLLPLFLSQDLLEVQLDLFFVRPKLHFVATDRARELKVKYEDRRWADNRSDLDNLAKGVMDCMTGKPYFPKGLVWSDDSQVVSMRVSKQWVDLPSQQGVLVQVKRVEVGAIQVPAFSKTVHNERLVVGLQGRKPEA